MKKSSRASALSVSPIAISVFLACLTPFAPAHAAETNADPNYLFAFKRLYVEPVQDDVDGVFRGPVEQSYNEVFGRNPRFELVNDKAQADAVLRTAITKKTTGLALDITLLLNPSGETFTAEHELIDAAATGRETGAKVKGLLKAALKRIPFYGTVSGRDGKELTFDIGSAHGLRARDIIQISRIDNVKRHPLLKSIVDVQLVPVGSAVVDSVEETIAFGHVRNEITGETIQKLHKITAIEGHLPEQVVEKPRDESDRRSRYVESDESGVLAGDRPQLGYVGLGLGLAGFSSSTTDAGGLATYSGSAFNPSFKIQGELWLTKRWFADLTLGVGVASYGQTLNGTTATATTVENSQSTSMRTFGISVGYKYLPENDLHGPQIYAKLGYLSYAWSTNIDPSTLLSSKSYSGLNLGIGGQLPINSPEWGARLDVGLLLFPGVSEDDVYKPLGTNTGASGATFFVGGYYYFSPRIALRVGPQIEIFSGSNEQSGASSSQKTFGLFGSVLYYF